MRGGRLLACLRRDAIGVPIHENAPGHLQHSTEASSRAEENLMAPSIYWISKFTRNVVGGCRFLRDEPKPQVKALGWYLYY